MTVVPNKHYTQSFPVWPERPWLPVHSSFSSELVRGYSLWLEKPLGFKMTLDRAEASLLAGPLPNSEVAVEMPAEPCFSPVVWTFRWGGGCRVLGPSPSLGSLYSLWSSGLRWNHAPFRNKARALGSTLLPGKQSEGLSYLLSDPTVGIPGCTGVLLHHREWGGILIFCTLGSDDGVLWCLRKYGFKLSEAKDSLDTIIPV